MIPVQVNTSAPGGMLDRFERLRSADLDEVRAQVSRVFCEHELLVVGRAQRLDTRLCYRAVGPISFGRMRYGAAVDIDPGALGDFFLLQMPTRGHETIMVGNAVVQSSPSVASIISPTLAFRMHHGQHTEKLFIRIDRAALERQFTQLYARAPRGELEFAPDISTPLAPGAGLRRLIDWLFAEASDGDLLDHPLVSARIKETLMAALLGTLSHNQPDVSRPDRPIVSPRCVIRAQEYIEQHAHEPLTAGAIAAYAGISVRSLFVSFRKYRDTTPMAYLKDLRLDRVRAELGQPSACRGSVTRTALRWGFSHFGQFSAAYRLRFGELPSQTLAHGRGR